MKTGTKVSYTGCGLIFQSGSDWWKRKKTATSNSWSEPFPRKKWIL